MVYYFICKTWFIQQHLQNRIFLYQLLHIKDMVTLTYFFVESLLSPHRLYFPGSSKGSFIFAFATDWKVYTTDLCGPVVKHWFEWKIAQTANGSTGQDQ